jgi:hypothetical protein
MPRLDQNLGIKQVDRQVSWEMRQPGKRRLASEAQFF